MDPKEKAKELVEKFLPHAMYYIHDLTPRYRMKQEQRENAIECASICVDELIKEVELHGLMYMIEWFIGKKLKRIGGTMKQTIEEAATNYAYGQHNIPGHTKKMDLFDRIAFITGAKSQAAKDFHIQGTYSEEELMDFALFYYNHQGRPLLWGKNLFIVWLEEHKKRKDETGHF